MRPLQTYFNAYRGLPSSLYVLFGATVINSVGMFVFPFLTLYLTGRLGMSQEEAGVFIMIVNLAYIPANFIGGKIADTFGRKKLMVTAQVLSGLCYIPCGFQSIGGNVRWFLLASVFFDGLTDPARSAMMTDLTTPETRRPGFSLTYLGHNLGFAVGMIIAGFLFEKRRHGSYWGNAIAISPRSASSRSRSPKPSPPTNRSRRVLVPAGRTRGTVGTSFRQCSQGHI